MNSEVREIQFPTTTSFIKHSIIIPTYNKCTQLLKPCIESILQYTDLIETEIIVSANGCTDQTKDYIISLAHPNIRLIWSDDRLGYPKAVNAGIRHAKGEYIIPLNNDTVLLAQQKNFWIEELKKPFLTDPMTGVTGPMKTFSPSANRKFLIFFCVMIHKKVIDKIGYLDETYGDGYGEDTAFCCEAEDAGFKITQVPEDSEIYYAEKRMTGRFPIYHEGNVTFKNWEGGEQLLANNNKLLEKYDKTKNPKYHITQTKTEKPIQIIDHDEEGLNIKRAMECDGHMSLVEVTYLAKCAKDKKVIIEIGSWHGRSSRALADNLPEGGKLFCVDTWNGSKVEKETSHASAKWMDGDHAFYEFTQNNFDLIEQGIIIPIRMSSKNASELFKEKGVKADMIFIDAGHTYEEIKEDLDIWFPVLNDGGLFCGHDYDLPMWAGVTQAVNEFAQKQAVIIHNDFASTGTIWSIQLEKFIDVGIIMPVYNDEKNIAFTIEAIQNQTNENWMLVIVDDNSNDNTLNIISDYASQYNRIKIRSSITNIKQAECRNDAIEYLLNNHVKYIAYCDSDDKWNRDHLEKSIEFLDKTGADMVYSDADFVSDDGSPLQSLAPYVEEFDKDRLKQGNFIYISSVVHKKECLSVGRFDKTLVPLEDWEYWLKISEKYKIVHRKEKSITYLCKESGHNSTEEQTQVARRKIIERYSDTTSYSSQQAEPRPLIYDCFPFFNELDILEIRLNELYNKVDRFVIVEADKTHQGKTKPYHFLNNIQRYKKFLDKITHVMIRDYPFLPPEASVTDRSWAIERHQRDCIMRGLTNCKDNDIIIISDCDEIPNADKIKKYDNIRAFKQRLFYYNFNCEATDPWNEAKILSYKELKQLTPCGARYRPNCELIEDGGWHLSYFKDVDGIVEKLNATAHAEYNTPFYTDKERIKQAMINCKDLFGRNLSYKFNPNIYKVSLPKYVGSNMEEFEQKGLIVSEREGKINLQRQKKIVIVMTHYNREFLLIRTLNSIERSSHENLEVVIVDDASTGTTYWDNIISPLQYPIHLIKIKPEEKFWNNPVIAYNKGIEKAIELGAEIIMVQNAECLHHGDVISHANKNVTKSNYLSFACYSIDQENTNKTNIEDQIDSIIENNNTHAVKNGQNAWYNHAVLRPHGYDFCVALTIENMIKLNGYDERFAFGVAYGDNDLIDRVKNLGLNVDIPEKPIVVHQWHYAGEDIYSRTKLVENNKTLYENLKREQRTIATHTHTRDFTITFASNWNKRQGIKKIKQ